MELENFAQVHYKFYRTLGQYADWYASPEGQVITKNRRRKTIKPAVTYKVYCPEHRTKRAYIKVETIVNKKPVKEYLHRVIAKMFVTGYQKGLQVDHLNGYKWDNRATNLEWVTAKENMRRYFQTADALRRNKAISETVKKEWSKKKKQQARTK